jgi:hypothetical protein
MDFQPVDIGNYILVVTNMFGSVTSAVATLTITSPPIITGLPTDITTPAATSVSFAVTAAGTGPFSYQWEFDGTNFVGATNAILSLNNVQLDQTGSYGVLVSNAYGGVTSSNVILTVVPSIVTIQPSSQSAKEDTTVSFNAIISGQGPFSYQWQFGATNIQNATNGTLTLTGLQVNQSGAYAVVVSNSFGVVTSSNAQLTVIPWPNVQPPSQTNLIGATVSFTANYGGTTPLSYQWYFNGNFLSDGGQYGGSATSLLSISNIQNYNIGGYQVVIGTAANVLTSTVAFLIVTNYPHTVHYVNLNNSNPSYPYLDWSTAATNIQDAIDAAFNGDQILVTNGIYQVGGRIVYGSLTNRVVVNKAIMVQSVNGPAVTIIQGYQVPGTTNGDSAVRCVYLTNNAALIGFTLTNGATRNAGDANKEESGGGVWCESIAGAIVSNCAITVNAAFYQGGGAYQGTLGYCILNSNSVASSSYGYGGGAYQSYLVNCVVTGNSVHGSFGSYGGGTCNANLTNCVLAGNLCNGYGGGACNGNLVNCTITGNFASSTGGGTYNANQINCINYFNICPINGATNYYGGSFSYCCTTPWPGWNGGNITNDPLLASASHLSLNSPCRGAGKAAAASGVDIDGEPWANPPSMGCDELYPGNVTGNVSVGIVASDTNCAVGYAANLQANITGLVYASKWDFGDGTVVSNRPYISHSWSAVGDYPVVLTAYNDTYPTGQIATLTMHVYVPAVLYVAISNQAPVAPYDSWAKAATNIQNAVDAAYPGNLILVSNGVYKIGSKTSSDGGLNRVVVTNFVTLQSLNGAAVTRIDGGQTMRCVYLTNGAALIGFTLTNGNSFNDGGGISCASTNALISNCLIINNSAYNNGGGVYSGTLSNCALVGNSAYSGGGAANSMLNNCAIISNSTPAGGYGGGTYLCVLSSCALIGNVAVSQNGIYDSQGGGAFGGTLNNCTLARNSANYGGAIYGGVLDNCIITNNSAQYGGGASGTSSFNYTNCILNDCTLAFNSAGSYGGGAFLAQLNNCAISNNAASANNGYGGGAEGGMLNNCILTGNMARNGGGVDGHYFRRPVLINCTLAGNLATNGGGASFCILNNCIIYYNQGQPKNNSVNTLNYCCTPDPGSVGCITNAPLFINFAGGDFHLQPNSPCINSGDNAYVTTTTDLDGNPRIVGGTVDIGAYEYQTPSSVLSYAWAQQYGLPTDGSADYLDLDGTGMNNWQKWIAGLNPTNPASILAMLTPVPTNNPSGLVVSWQSVNTRTYYLQSSSNLGAQPAFSTIQSNIVGHAGTTSYTDTNAVGSGPYFYRVGVQ